MSKEKTFGQLQAQLEIFMQQARPGLLRQATQFGIAAEQAEDVVQETLLQAWRHLAELRAPELFHAWLYGICRNICLNWQRTKGAQFEHSHLLLSQLLIDEGGQGVDVPDHEGVFDPVEELQRQDLERLLERALSYLPKQARRGIELYYLEELPQKEVALHLGINEKTFKVQMHRTRKQLWHILHTELRVEALAFGLVLDDEDQGHLRNTSIWCWICGQHRLRGTLKTIQGRGTQLELYCPQCSYETQKGFLISGGFLPREGVRSFWPAFKQLAERVQPAWYEALARGYRQCFICGGSGRLRIEQLEAPFLTSRTWITMDCPRCGDGLGLVSCLQAIPSEPFFAFLKQYPRARYEPEQRVSYNGEVALKVCLTAQNNQAKLLYYLQPETLQILGSVIEG